MKTTLKQYITIELSEDQARMLKEMLRNTPGGLNPSEEDQECKSVRRELFETLDKAFPSTRSDRAAIYDKTFAR